jgi:putative heme-binding domain-containing protein
MRHMLILTLLTGMVSADSVAPPATDNSIAAELASFQVAEGYEVSLYADETNQIANPVAMRWGPKGRLWVLCTLVYPQIIPLTPANDKLFLLEDTDQDGRVDQTTIWLDGLDMPTGFALGNGGVYIGEGSNLVFWKDTNGDDRADTREEIFSGFGTGDTHQNINSFTWSPDGQLYFCQGLHCFSRVETPWGIVRLNEHGVWQCRPHERRLHAFRGGSGQNPWGIAFGPWGEPFIKGNNNELSELLPVMVPTEHFQAPLDIGRTKIKSMICEIVDAPGLPADLQGDVLIAGYFAHVIDRLDMEPDGSGHKGTLQPPLLTSSHRSFRPVDIQTGPDGALYIADWFNPIIGHYQASLRHPDRDQVHGRIWRITSKGQKLNPIKDLTRMPLPQLLDALPHAPLKERERIRIALSSLAHTDVIAAAKERLAGGAPDARSAFEWANVLAWHGSSAAPHLAVSDQPLARAFSARLGARDPEGGLAELESLVRDAHPRVRLEAVVALSYAAEPEAITAALQALDHPMDRFITAALTQTTHALKAVWWPAFMEGRIMFKRPEHLAFALQQASGKQALQTVRAMVADPKLDAALGDTLMILLTQIGDQSDVLTLLARGSDRPKVLASLAEQAELRNLKLGDAHEMKLRARIHAQPDIAIPLIQLAGTWNMQGLKRLLKEKALDPTMTNTVRVAAVGSWARLEGAGALKPLRALALQDKNKDVRLAALTATHQLDRTEATTIAAEALRKTEDAEETKVMVSIILGSQGGGKALAAALGTVPIPTDTATRIRSAMGSIGLYSPELDELLASDKGAVGIPEYSEAFVSALAHEVKSTGRAKMGAAIYQRPGLSCGACHKLGEVGGVLGPELTAVGAGLPMELIIEAVLWPKRQVKEGFMASTLVLKDGQTISGYVQRETAEQIVIRNAASGTDETLAKRHLTSRADAGTIMPPGLTAGLTREELRDLIYYLSELRL